MGGVAGVRAGEEVQAAEVSVGAGKGALGVAYTSHAYAGECG